MNENLEQICFTIISSSGDAKSLAIEAIDKSSENKFSEAWKKIEDAEVSALVAEKAHGELIFSEAKGEKVEISLLLMHSEDQLLSSQTIIVLAKKMIQMQEKFVNLLKSK